MATPSPAERFAAEIQARAAAWWPSVRGARAQLRRRQELLNSTIYDFDVTVADGGARGVVVKVPFPESKRARYAEGRHAVVTRSPKTAVGDKLSCEQAALEHVHGWFAETADPRFGTVRPLGVLAEPPGLFLERCDAPLLRDRIAAGADCAELERACRHAGAWLARFHAAPGPAHTRARGAARDEVVEATRGILAALRPVLGEAGCAALAGRFAAGARAALPAALPLGLHHGDFGPRNVFVEPDGRVVVFDTMAAWRAPVYEDLSEFMLACAGWMRVAWRAPRPVPALTGALLAGYFGPQPVASAAVAWFEAQRLAERWATYVQRAAQASGAKALAKRARARVAGRCFRRAIVARLATAEVGA